MKFGNQTSAPHELKLKKQVTIKLNCLYNTGHWSVSIFYLSNHQKKPERKKKGAKSEI